MLEITLDTWLISDTHFNHANIVKYCGRPENHTQIMEKNWFQAVAMDDTVLHLGDIFMGQQAYSLAIMNRLPGKKWFVRGNHDKKSLHFYMDAGFKHVGSVKREWGEILNAAYYESPDGLRVLFTHYPDKTHQDQWDVNIHGHIHNNGYNPTTPRDLDYRNISVEVMDYKPVKLRDILYHGQYQARAHTHDWDKQSREGEKKVVMPTANEISYFGDANE